MQWNLWGIKHRSNWKCCWEEKPTSLFVAWAIILWSSLIFLISNMVTKLNLRITSQVFSKNLKNQRTLRYPKNSLQLSYDSTETSDVKTRRKSNQCWIYSNTCFISTFFRLVQILCNLVPGGSSLWH